MKLKQIYLRISLDLPNWNSKQRAGKPHKQRTFRLLVCGVIPF